MPAGTPARQLTKTAIRDKLLADVIPVVQRTCSIIGVKCNWRVQGGLHGIKSSWKEIVKKRNECDIAIQKTPGVAFFFSAISTFTTKKDKKAECPEEEDEEEEEQQDDSDDGSSIATQLSQSSGIAQATKQKLHPSMTYWVAMQSPNGAPVDPLVLHKRLVKCEVEVNSTRASSKKGDERLLKLCQLVKDHKNALMSSLNKESFNSYWQCMCEDFELGALNSPQCDQVVRLVVISREFSKKLAPAIRSLNEVGLVFDVFNHHHLAEENHENPPSKQLCEPLTVLCNDVERVLQKLNYTYRRGQVYKKCEGAVFTYMRLCSMDSFLNTLLGNIDFKDRLLKYMPRLRLLLEHKDSQAISQMKINEDLIEVEGGWFWSFRERQFVYGYLEEREIGRTSPRAFVKYKHDVQLTDAKFFSEILTNSLSPDQIALFCEDFLRLFERRHYHKQKVPCLIGESNSGKTSLFLATTMVIDATKIAKITKQKAFNKAMIQDDTLLINLDEATEDLMTIDDWKVLTQGGWTAHDRKWKTAEGFTNDAPMYVTCQKELDFGNKADNDAMANRLNKYYFRSLPEVKTEAAGWIKSHPMECITWCAAEAKRCNVNVREVEEDPGKGGMSSQDLDHIMAVRLDEEEMSPAVEHEADENEKTSSEEDEPMECSFDEQIAELERAKEECIYDAALSRMLGWMMDVVRNKRKDLGRVVREGNRAVWEAQRENLRQNGIGEELLLLMPSEPGEPIPTPLQEDINKARATHRKEQENQSKERREKDQRSAVKAIFMEDRVLSRERQMRDLQKTFVQVKDRPLLRMSVKYRIDVLQNALKTIHEDSGTICDYAVKARRLALVKLGLVTPAEAKQIVRTVYEVLPLENWPTVGTSVATGSGDKGEQSEEDIEDEEERQIFNTPATPASKKSATHKPLQFKIHKAAKKRKHPLTQPAAGQVKITKFFSSQK